MDVDHDTEKDEDSPRQITRKRLKTDLDEEDGEESEPTFKAKPAEALIKNMDLLKDKFSKVHYNTINKEMNDREELFH